MTGLARTLLDLAEVVHPRRLDDALEAAERLRLLDVDELRATSDRNPGRRGLQPLLAWLSTHHHAPEETRSKLERSFLRLCERAGLPRPAMNASVAGFDVDAVWADALVVVEVDSFEFHRTRRAFERDRRRDAQLQCAGYRVLRVTDRRMEREPDAVAADLRALLSSASAPRAVRPGRADPPAARPASRPAAPPSR